MQSLTLSPTPSRRSAFRRRTGLLLAAALLTGALSTLVAPATSASAEAIDCGYSPGLSEYIGAGREGVTCMGGGMRTPGTVYGSGSLPGQIDPPAWVAGTKCNNMLPLVPDAFYAWGPVTASTTAWDVVRADGVKYHTTMTIYDRNGRIAAIRSTETAAGKPIEMRFNDYTLFDSGVLLISTFNCQTDGTWVDQTPMIITPPGLASVPVPPAGAAPSVQTTASMAPVPFHPGQFFLRVNVTNNRPAVTRTGYLLDLDLESYTIAELIQSPRDSSCSVALTHAELCSAGSVLPGETQTYTFVVTQRSGLAAGAPLSMKTLFDGFVKVGHVNRAGTEMTPTTVTP